jgi:hypothetical protein
VSYQVSSGNTSLPLRFLLVLTSDHITGATGKTPTVTISKNDGSGFASPAGAVSELGNGWYQVAANASDASVLGPLTLHATAAACDPADEEFIVTAAQTATASVTVRELLTRALKRIKVYGAGETPTAEDLADAFWLFNDLIDSFGIESLMKYQMTRTTFDLNDSQGVPGAPYTVGSGGDIDIARPVDIHRMTFQDTSVSPTLEYPIWMLTEQAYTSIPMKTLTSPFPSCAYYEPTMPLGSLYVWMTPTSATLEGVLYVLASISKFSALSDLVVLPPGYQRFVRDMLALELWPEFREGSPDPYLMAQAREAKSFIKAGNVRPVDLYLDAAVTGRRHTYNIESDN